MKDNNISLNNDEKKGDNGEKKGGGVLVVVTLLVFAVIFVAVLYAYAKSPQRAARLSAQSMSEQRGVLVPDLASQYDEAAYLERIRRESSSGGQGGTGASNQADYRASSNSAASSLLEAYYALAPYAGYGTEQCIEPTEVGCRTNGIFALIKKSEISDETVLKYYLNKDYYKKVMAQGGNALGMAIPYKVYVYSDTMNLLSQTVEATIDSIRYLITYTKDKDGLINSISAKVM